MYFDTTDLKLCVNVANAGSITQGAKLTYLTLQSAICNLQVNEYVG